MSKTPPVRVVLRVRPLNKKELKDPDVIQCVFVSENNNIVTAGLENSSKVEKVTLDYVFPIETSQHDIFEELGKPMIDNVFEGFNTTIFC